MAKTVRCCSTRASSLLFSSLRAVARLRREAPKTPRRSCPGWRSTARRICRSLWRMKTSSAS
eukprot:scaffold1785_cov247-Pinguiococcus_pyrenoidosus.AAC.11